ncbi:MAG: choice-of-anchor D domain-containing protein [Pyrinomonadaceae bacterium]
MRLLNDTSYDSNLRGKALRLLATLICAAACGAAAFGQTTPPPTLTLNTNFSLFFFGRVNTGALSPNTVITISNGGTGGVTISNVTITGSNAGDFTLVGTTCVGVTLTPTGTCTATVRFNPLAVGSRTANLTVTDTAAGSQHLVPLRGTGLNPSIPNKAVGPVDPRVGFPLWYQDELGVKLQLCLDLSGNCITTPPVSGPASVTTANINFPDEAFYWYADARINRSSGGNVRLVIAKEAAFTTPLPSIGNQITFDRIRVRIDQLTPGATYTITHPFGVMTAVANADGGIVINSSLKTTTTASTAGTTTTASAGTATTADGFTAAPAPASGTTTTTDTAAAPPADTAAAPPADGDGAAVANSGGSSGSTAEINTTEDIGCGGAPCDFRMVMEGKISRFLRWDTGAPAGYLGNPNVLHAITGSPFATNYFKVDGPNVGGAGINSIQTNLFTVSGKLF